MYRRTLVSHVLTPTTRRRRRPTAAAHASGANTFQDDGRVSRTYYPPSIPRVRGVAQAGQDTVALTLESGKVVTVTARADTYMHPDGALVTGYRSEGQIYLIPSPHQRWQAKVWLGLYGGEQDSEEQRFDAYLMNLPSVTEAGWTNGVLSLAHVGRTGQQYACQFTGKVTVNFVDSADLLRDQFTRYPLRVAIQEEKEDFEYMSTFRVDHTPEGYAVLRALGWLAPLPDLNPTLTKDKA